VATALHVPLDVFTVRKLGVPGHPELAMGAIASGGVQVLNDEVLAGISRRPTRSRPWRARRCASSSAASGSIATGVR
jgi:predicted phosphoribosyltransferase